MPEAGHNLSIFSVRKSASWSDQVKREFAHCKCAAGLKRVLKHNKRKVNSLQPSNQEVELSALCSLIRDAERQWRFGQLLVWGSHLSGIAPFLYCESLDGAFAQCLDVIQKTGGGQNVRGPWKAEEPLGPNLEHEIKLAVLTGSSKTVVTENNTVKSFYIYSSVGIFWPKSNSQEFYDTVSNPPSAHLNKNSRMFLALSVKTRLSKS